MILFHCLLESVAIKRAYIGAHKVLEVVSEIHGVRAHLPCASFDGVRRDRCYIRRVPPLIEIPRGFESGEHAHHLKHASLSVKDVSEGTEFLRHARVYIFFVAWLIGKDCFWRRFPPSDEFLQKFRLRTPSGEYLLQRLSELSGRHGRPGSRFLTGPHAAPARLALFRQREVERLNRVATHPPVHINPRAALETLYRRLRPRSEDSAVNPTRTEIDTFAKFDERVLHCAHPALPYGPLQEDALTRHHIHKVRIANQSPASSAGDFLPAGDALVQPADDHPGDRLFRDLEVHAIDSSGESPTPEPAKPVENREKAKESALRDVLTPIDSTAAFRPRTRKGPTSTRPVTCSAKSPVGSLQSSVFRPGMPSSLIMVDSDAEWSPRLNVSNGGMGTMSLSLLMAGYALLGFELTILRGAPDYVELFFAARLSTVTVIRRQFNQIAGAIHTAPPCRIKAKSPRWRGSGQ